MDNWISACNWIIHWMWLFLEHKAKLFPWNHVGVTDLAYSICLLLLVNWDILMWEIHVSNLDSLYGRIPISKVFTEPKNLWLEIYAQSPIIHIVSCYPSFSPAYTRVDQTSLSPTWISLWIHVVYNCFTYNNFYLETRFFNWWIVFDWAPKRSLIP